MADMEQDTRVLSEPEAHEQYDDYLNEVFGDVTIAGLTYPTARALQDVDPIAYRVSFHDWLDAEGIELSD